MQNLHSSSPQFCRLPEDVKHNNPVFRPSTQSLAVALQKRLSDSVSKVIFGHDVAAQDVLGSKLDPVRSASNVLCRFMPADDAISVLEHRLDLIIDPGAGQPEIDGAVLALALHFFVELMKSGEKLLVGDWFVVVLLLAAFETFLWRKHLLLLLVGVEHNKTDVGL